jgi:indolepyruvate ferredoxin oxidoreductase, beta subunit
MNNERNTPYSVVVAGVGGQGSVTIAQLILGAAWKAGYQVIQSEVHGMSQRGGSVSAQILFDKKEVSSPIVMEGTGDLLIGIEPLETLRYVHLMNENATVVSSTCTVKNMATYPDEKVVISQFENVSNATLVDTDKHSKTLKNRHAGNIILLGIGSKKLPISKDTWYEVIQERFATKGEAVIQKNIEAFEFGRNF